MSMNTLETDILKLQELAASAGAQGYLDTLSNKMMQLADLLGIKTQRALVRSRFQRVDQISIHFSTWRKKNGQSRTFHESSDLLIDPADIRKRAAVFMKTCIK